MDERSGVSYGIRVVRAGISDCQADNRRQNQTKNDPKRTGEENRHRPGGNFQIGRYERQAIDFFTNTGSSSIKDGNKYHGQVKFAKIRL